MLSNKTQINTNKGMRKIILLCWFGSFTCGSVHTVNPQPQRLYVEEPTSHSHKRLQKQPPIHIPHLPFFQNNKTEIEVKITKEQGHPNKAKYSSEINFQIVTRQYTE